MPDDLIGRVALEPLRARVPIHNDPARVQHVDRVVNDAFDKDAETTLTFQQRIPCRDAFRDVARDLREAYELAVLVADLMQNCVAEEAGAVFPHAPALGLMPTMRACSF